MMGNAAEQMPAPQESSEDVELTEREKAFMDRADMTPEQLAQYNRWKKIDMELGGDQAL